MERRRESFTVHHFDADAFGLLAVPRLTGMLQEVAGHHAEALGVGAEPLRARGLGWVLGRQRLEIGRPAGVGDRLEVETWPSGADRLWALRDFVVRLGGGEEVARATSSWLLVELEGRRPARPDRVLDPRLHPEAEHALPPLRGKLQELERPQLERAFRVRYEDIDQLRHANNGSYVTWALEAVPEELWRGSRLRSLEVQYLAESLQGERVLARSAPEGEAGWLHAVVREEDGRELARLRTGWVAR